MSEINRIDLSRFILDEKDIAGSHIDVHSEIVKTAVAEVSQLNEKTVEQALIVKQQEAIEDLKEQKSQLLAKLGAIGVLMKDVRYDEALALLPPSCADVVGELKAEAVSSIKFDIGDAIAVLDNSGDGSFGSYDVEQIRFELAFISDVILANKANQLRSPEQEKGLA
jgi:hypothetical protein